MYGCNKLYCEHLGRYYAKFYKQLAAEPPSGRVDFRCVRFPGLISAVTVPSGGTSDYAPEMIHRRREGEPYACFVRPDTRIPFMAMPDAIDALLQLASALARAADEDGLQPDGIQPDGRRDPRRSDARVSTRVRHVEHDEKRQRIVDSWPADVDDTAARRDWGFAPRYDFTRAFDDYLIPTIGRYRLEMRRSIGIASARLARRCSAQWLSRDPLRVVALPTLRLLVLAVGQHDADYVDAYYGPPEWRKEAEAEKPPLPRSTRSRGARSEIAGVATRDQPTRTVDAAPQYLDAAARALRAGGDAPGQEMTLRRGVAGALRRGGAHETGGGVRGGAHAARGEAAGRGSLIERYDRSSRRSSFPRSVDRVFQEAIAAAAAARWAHRSAAEGELHGRIRHRQDRGAATTGIRATSQPDPGQHRPADLHRSRDRSRVPRRLPGPSRLQRAAREEPRAAIAAGSSSPSIRCSRRSR